AVPRQQVVAGHPLDAEPVRHQGGPGAEVEDPRSHACRVRAGPQSTIIGSAPVLTIELTCMATGLRPAPNSWRITKVSGAMRAGSRGAPGACRSDAVVALPLDGDRSAPRQADPRAAPAASVLRQQLVEPLAGVVEDGHRLLHLSGSGRQ